MKRLDIFIQNGEQKLAACGYSSQKNCLKNTHELFAFSEAATFFSCTHFFFSLFKQKP